MLSVKLTVFLACVVGIYAFERTREQIALRGFDPQEIPIVDGLTDFQIQFHPDFACPIGAKCEITVEIEEMDCTAHPDGTPDPDPTYIWFYPLTALGYSEEFGDDRYNPHKKDICEDFQGDGRTRMSILENFDLTSVLITPAGSKWASGESSVRLFVKITATKYLTLDSSMQDLELRVSSPVIHEILLGDLDLETCPSEECSHSISTVIKGMDCSRTGTLLSMTTIHSDETTMAHDLCTMSTKPFQLVPTDGTVTAVQLTPIGDWETEGVGAVLTFTLHVHPNSGSCPMGYFDCGDCEGKEVTAPTSCILDDFRCDKRPHCGLPCYADELEGPCRRLGSNTTDIIYTGDLHDLYVYLLKLFLTTSALTVLLVIGIVFLFAQKFESIGQRIRRQSQRHEQFVVEPLPPNYLTLGINLDNEKRINS